MPTLYDLREKTARALSKFLKGEQAGSEYSMHKHRALIIQLDDVIKTAERDLPPATLRDLKRESTVASRTSVKKLEAMVRAGERKFTGAVSSLNIPVAKVLTNVKRTMMGRFEHKSDRYAGDVGRRIRNELAVGVIRGESVGEMTKRIMGPAEYARAAKRGPTAVADKMADKVLFKSQYEAERLVRTEIINAYTETQIEGLHEAEADDPGYQKMWDAANDKRTCLLCYSLNGKVVDLNQSFPGGYQGPPAHPNDRCCLVPWHRGWGSPKGAV
jgi:SPP1 gp7 family putative phage head morphogenesis protein